MTELDVMPSIVFDITIEGILSGFSIFITRYLDQNWFIDTSSVTFSVSSVYFDFVTILFVDALLLSWMNHPIFHHMISLWWNQTGFGEKKLP